MTWNNCGIFLVSCAVVSAVGCGNGENNGNNGTTNGATNDATNGMPNGDTNGDTNGTPNNSNNNSNTNNSNNNSNTNNTNGGLVGDCSLLEVDTDGDDTADQTTLALLDADGNEDELWQDADGDGAYDLYIDNTYDAEGRITEQLGDLGDDGTIDLHIYIEYDADGNETSVRWDEGDDGTDDFVRLQTYDDDGQRTGLTRDGALNAQGNGIAEAADGTDDYVFTAEYFDIDKPMLAEWDTDGDGTADAISTWTYDMGTGNLTEFTMDGRVEPNATQSNGQPAPDPPLLEAADGDVDYRRFDLVYDEDGNVIEDKVDGRMNVIDGTFSQAPDGTADLRTFEFDDDGNLTRWTYDEDNDGSVEGILAYTYDADGNMEERTVDGLVDNDQLILEAQDGTVDERISNTWDGENITSHARDFGDDGSAEVTISWEYDADGNLTHYEQDGDTPGTAWELETPADGTPDISIDQEYDAMGRRTSYLREVDGEFDLAATWTFAACSELQ
jgi:hypothetical protein